MLYASAFGQETLPIYTDYLTDNIYLVHPAGAGVSDYGKIRLTGRRQWLNYDEAPELQTLSFHTHLGSNAAMGVAFFIDKNGHFAQVGGQLTYAYHISLDEQNTKQFSFALSALAIQNTLDASNYNLQDSDVPAQIQSENYYNADMGIAYRDKGLFSFYSIKNLLPTERVLFDGQLENNNLRRHLITLGYHFNKKEVALISYEPSVMLQYIEQTQEVFFDTNIKVFVPLENGELYGGLSYRRGFDNTIEAANHFTPFLGIKHHNFVVSYAYTRQQNKIVFSSDGFHQITLGYNFYLDRYSREASWDL
jgi:type IX secretion system PorP/SprF family membrane protein